MRNNAFRLIFPAAVLAASLIACHHDSTTAPTAPTPSLGYAFTADAGIRILSGTQPAVLVAGGKVLIYLGSGGALDSVWSSSDGLTFTEVHASFPVGSSYSFVTLGTNQYRMFYFNAASGRLHSAESTDGLNWTVVDTTPRIVLAANALPRVIQAANGCRVYYTVASGGTLASSFASDCLTFVPEVGSLPGAGTVSQYSDAAPLADSGTALIAMTRFPVNATDQASIWLAAATSARVWAVDSSALITAASGRSVSQAAGIPISTGFRVYYTSFAGSVNGVTEPTQGQILSGVITKK